MISSGGAGSILLATAACIAGKDPEKIKRLPDTTGMKNEVVIVRQHRSGFDHACRTTGAKIVEVETADQLKSAIGPQTAMLYWVNIEEPKGKVSAKEFLAAGKSAGIPVFNDAAAERSDDGRFDDLLAKAVVHHAASASGLPVPPRTVALAPDTAIESWAPTQAVGVDTEVLEWIAGQMRGKRRGNGTLMALVATLIGAATLPLAQLPNMFDIGL